MKIRIQDNKLRIRLSETEVANFEKGQTIRSKTVFGANASLDFSLGNSIDSQYHVTIFGSEILVMVPSEIVKEWALSERLALQEKLDVTSNELLQLSIEKDLAKEHG